MAKTNIQGEGSAASEKLLAQGTSGHSVESSTRGGLHFCTEPIRSDGVKSAGLIGRLQMPANGGDVLGIPLNIKKLKLESW